MMSQELAYDPAQLSPDIIEHLCRVKTPGRLLRLKGNNFLVSSRLRYRSCMCRKATQERFCICGKQYPKSDRLMVLLQRGISHVARLVCRDHWYATRLEPFAEFGAHEGA
jgi:hypothetical protein